MAIFKTATRFDTLEKHFQEFNQIFRPLSVKALTLKPVIFLLKDNQA